MDTAAHAGQAIVKMNPLVLARILHYNTQSRRRDLGRLAAKADTLHREGLASGKPTDTPGTDALRALFGIPAPTPTQAASPATAELAGTS